MKYPFISNKHLPNWKSSRLMLIGVGLVLLLSVGACSGQAAPTAQPSQASMDPEEVQALVQAAVEAAITKSATGSGEGISRQELRDLVA